MDNKKIGKKIAFERNKLNLTQTGLANKLCVSPKTISKWESGNGLPSIDFLPDLAKLFGITIDELLDQEPKEVVVNTLEEIKPMTIFQLLSPNYVKFPKQVLELLKEEWLSYILKEEDLTLTEFSAFIDTHSKPKSILDCVDKLVSMENVLCSKIQRKFRIGYPKAFKIREILIKNSMIDSNDYSWLDKDYNKLCDILTEELNGVPCEITNTIDKTDYINLDFESIKLINDNFSTEEKKQALELLEVCSVDDNSPCDSTLICFKRETISNILSISNNCLNIDVYNIDELSNIQDIVKISNINQSLIVVESSKDSTILDLMSLCNIKIPTEIALKITEDLNSAYKLTIFYV